MISKRHKHNTNFQIAHFLAGACHTPDGAYFILMDLKEDRELAMKNASVVNKRNEAKVLRAKAYLANPQADEAGKLEANADIEEIINMNKEGAIAYEAALDELAFIEECIDRVKPLCKYAGKDGFSEIQAHEASQVDEWKHELIRRAENFILTSGTVPADEFNTMRMHPLFKKDILPRIKEVQANIFLPDGTPNMLGRQKIEDNLRGSFNVLELAAPKE
jgi:hypothetical protein